MSLLPFSCRWTIPLLMVSVVGWSAHARATPTVIDDFDDVSDWTGLMPESALVRQGAGAGRWANVVAQPAVRKRFPTPVDLSAFDHIGFWLYSSAAKRTRL